jgi:DNA-binding IclR family transcriptional regulator
MTEDRMGTVSRAMAVLTAIAEADGDVAIIDLAAMLDLPQSTCHRLLDLLAADGFVQRNAKLRRYGAGPSFQRLAALVAGRTDLATLAAPIMRRLTQESGETSLLGRYDSRERSLFFVYSADAPNPLRYRIDLFKPAPAGCGASGRAAAAFLPAEEREALFGGVASQWASPGAFAAELA